MSEFKDLTGKTFDRLKVLSRAENMGGRTAWNCLCECGNLCVIKSKYLLNGDTRSCGCLAKESAALNGKKGMRRNKYQIENGVMMVFFNDSDKYFLCDESDKSLVEAATWYLNNTGYVRGKLQNRKLVNFHNLIIKNTGDIVCDHINGDRLDNRRCNLRPVLRHQNMFNKGKYKNNTSGHTGVYQNPGNKKWYATITKDNHCYSLGFFDNVDDAVARRKEAEEELFGEYRRNA